jgi:hypothetical protein
LQIELQAQAFSEQRRDVGVGTDRGPRIAGIGGDRRGEWYHSHCEIAFPDELVTLGQRVDRLPVRLGVGAAGLFRAEIELGCRASGM